MAVRNSAVVGVSISQYVLRHVPGFGAGDMDWFIFMPTSQPVFTRHFVPKRNKMKPAFWHAVPGGYGQDAIQFEERKGIL